FERCALLTTKLLAAGVAVPAHIGELDDALERFRALERLRLTAHLHRVGAPWEEVLARLGIQMGADTARQLYRAFTTLPPELSCEMDAAGITLATPAGDAPPRPGLPRSRPGALGGGEGTGSPGASGRSGKRAWPLSRSRCRPS